MIVHSHSSTHRNRDLAIELFVYELLVEFEDPESWFWRLSISKFWIEKVQGAGLEELLDLF